MPMAILKARKAAGADVDVGGVTVSTIKDGLEGSRGAQAGDWVLISYQGKIKATGQVKIQQEDASTITATTIAFIITMLTVTVR